MTTFDADTLHALREVQEPRDPDRQAPQQRGGDLGRGRRRRRVRAFVARRTGALVPGPRGGRPRHAGVCRPPVGGAGDPGKRRASVERASREILRKYRHSSHAQEMVRGEILPTTLRLEPR